MRISIDYVFLYCQLFEGWIDDIREERVTLDRIKLCICGNPRVGKSAVRESLRKPYLQSLVGKDVEVTSEECRKAHVRHRNHIDATVGQRYLQRVGLCRASGELCHAPFLQCSPLLSTSRSLSRSRGRNCCGGLASSRRETLGKCLFARVQRSMVQCQCSVAKRKFTAYFLSSPGC